MFLFIPSLHLSITWFWCLLVLAYICLVAQAYLRAKKNQKPMPWRKVALYSALLIFIVLFVAGEPLFRALAYWAYGVDDRVIGANAPSNQVAADHLIGGWVQVGTLLSKLFAGVSFYITSYTLPWLLQRATHPVLTTWAKEQYDEDFKALTSKERFEVYGRLQLNQSLRIAASFIAAAQLV